MSLFSCRHPFRRLAIRSAEPEVVQIDKDFEKVTFKLRCNSCGADLDLGCSALIGGVEAFLARGALPSDTAPKGMP